MVKREGVFLSQNFLRRKNQKTIVFSLNSMKKIAGWIFLLMGLQANAQSLVQYALAPFNALLYNPAGAGIDQGNVFFHHKSQYIGISPINFSNQTLSADFPLNNINSGIGMIVHNDFSGFLANTAIIGNYAYHLPLKKSKLSFGIGIGAHHVFLNGNKLRVASGDYDIDILHNDKLLDNERVSSFAMDIDFGIRYVNNNLSLGVSMKNILNHGNTIFKDNSINTSRVLVGQIGYEIRLNESVSITPTGIVKTDFVKYQTAIATNFKLKQNFYTGFSLVGYNVNNFEAVGIYFGGKIIRNLTLIYNYDIPLNALKGVNNGSHEVLMQYRFEVKNKKTYKYFFNYNSRYL
jgi:type IX secretion system PorP/SprF family membrane protein